VIFAYTMIEHYFTFETFQSHACKAGLSRGGIFYPARHVYITLGSDPVILDSNDMKIAHISINKEMSQ